MKKGRSPGCPHRWPLDLLRVRLKKKHKLYHQMFSPLFWPHTDEWLSRNGHISTQNKEKHCFALIDNWWLFCNTEKDCVTIHFVLNSTTNTTKVLRGNMIYASYDLCKHTADDMKLTTGLFWTEVHLKNENIDGCVQTINQRKHPPFSSGLTCSEMDIWTNETLQQH